MSASWVVCCVVVACHEYLLLCAAFVHYDGGAAADRANATLNEVRARTLFVYYHMRYEADASDLAAGITGQTIYVDNGFNITAMADLDNA